MTYYRNMKKTEKIAFTGIFTALAFALSYIEYLIPFDAIGVPGVKLGLANLAVMAALYLFGFFSAAAVSLVRILLSWLIFGSFTAFAYSLIGGVLSLAAMYLLKKIDLFGEIGVSVSGAVAHNAGQLAAAWLLTSTPGVWYYLPVLAIAAAVTGTLNGLLLKIALPRVKKIIN